MSTQDDSAFQASWLSRRIKKLPDAFPNRAWDIGPIALARLSFMHDFHSQNPASDLKGNRCPSPSSSADPVAARPCDASPASKMRAEPLGPPIYWLLPHAERLLKPSARLTCDSGPSRLLSGACRGFCPSGRKFSCWCRRRIEMRQVTVSEAASNSSATCWARHACARVFFKERPATGAGRWRPALNATTNRAAGNPPPICVFGGDFYPARYRLSADEEGRRCQAEQPVSSTTNTTSSAGSASIPASRTSAGGV